MSDVACFPHAMVLALLCALLMPHPTDASPPATQELGGYATTHIVVKLRPGVADLMSVPAQSSPVRGAPRKAADSWSALPPTADADLRRAWDTWQVKRMRRGYGRPFARPDLAARHGLDRTFILEVPPETDTWAMAADFAALEEQVEFAEVDPIGTVAEWLPDDPDLLAQYALHNVGQTGGTVDADIDAPEAWMLHTGEPGTVTIAIVDTGVTPHPDFQDHMVPGINIADPSNPDDTTDECDPTGPPTGHGTHVAGIAAAIGNNNEGIAGVTWGANIMPVRVFAGTSPCGGFAFVTADGIEWAVDNGADIINISLQWCTGSASLQDAVNYAHSNGVLVVSAAGNRDFWTRFCSGPLQITAPAVYTNSMAITATQDDDALASFSGYGAQTDVCAPGEAIYSTYRTGGYGHMRGTSQATPYVSGLAALIKSFAPGLTHDEIRAVITNSADDLGAAGWDSLYGHGRINAYRALLVAGGIPWIVGSSPPDGSIDARQPSDPDGSSPSGWQWVELTFEGDIAQIDAADFELTENEIIVPDLYVVGVVILDESRGRVVFNRKISVDAWTTVKHVDSGTSITLGFLAGDVNADAETTLDDLTTLIDVVRGEHDPLPEWSTDMDRSGQTTPADLLRAIDLLNGGDTYPVFLSETLP